jgi:mannose-1-phosphate guanylyltransferase
MKAFLLVAGRGERLRPLTDTIPKCLLPINGKPLLEIWLEHLERSGIKEVLINTHWLHVKVEEFVNNWARNQRRMHIRLFHEPELLGGAGTILANREWVADSPFFIIYGDNLTGFNLQEMYRFHIKNGLALTLRTYKGADPRRSGIVTVNERGIVTDLEEKPKRPKSDIGAGGIYVTDGRIFDFFPKSHNVAEDGVLDLSHHILSRMAGQMTAYDSGEFSMDIGTPELYEEAQKLWAEMQDAEK